MTATGTWEPNQDNITPDADRVRQWADQNWSEAADLERQLDDLDKACLQRWIALPAAQWQSVLADLNATHLVNLMRLCTLAEEHLAGCEAGDQSTVIHAFRAHRQHHGTPERSLIQWIKANTRNRFLPYGPVL